MKKTFRERTISRFSSIAKKNKFMRYPCIAALSAILGAYHIGRHFVTNTKRYASVVFVILFFMTSCSFSFAVFAEKTGFIKAQETYSAIVEDSDVMLAVETEPGAEPADLEEDGLDELDLEYDPETDLTDVDVYTLDDILEGREDYQLGDDRQEDGGQEDAETVQVPEDFEFDSSDWRLILVNKQHPIPENYDFSLGKTKDNRTKDSILCDDRIIEDLLLMLQAAQKDGFNLGVRSPYRTSGRQETNFNNRIKDYMRQGLSYMDAYKETSQVITVPGCSEHEIGLAVDITCDTYIPLKQGFADTEEGKWLAEHSYEYGFTLRYPSGKEYITGIKYEPWHFRYVGREAARIMHDENICLEEFWDKYL